MGNTPWQGDACSLVDEFRAGRRSPAEELQATLDAIGASSLNAFCFVDREQAEASARTADVSKPFGGVPIGVKELDSVPVNFLAMLDITGGNSGSPVLNKNAELVGLLFDGTLDGVISDWDFNDRMNRSIVLDARYMLWQMKVVDKAERLLKEMGAK